MFETYRKRMARQGSSVRLANKYQSEAIMVHGFENSQAYRKVRIGGEEYDARILSDSKTTVRGGNGNYVIQMKDDIPLKAGTYIEVPDAQGNYDYWLTLYESDAVLFPKHIIKKCNYLLKWKNSSGEIIKRWAVFGDNTRIMDGERKTFNNKTTLPYSGSSVILPCDEETINIRIDKRFIIDHQDVEGNPEAWIVTNRNVISKRFNEYDGVVEFYLSRHQFNHDVDSKEYMIADYNASYDKVKEVDPALNYDCRIVYNGTSDLKMGTPFKKYTAEFYVDGELQNDIIADWEIILNDDYEDRFTYTFDGNTAKIKCKFDSVLMGSHIRLIASNEEIGCSFELPIKVVNNI